ncbi:MAG TPA: response regulator transcription factor, partial [Caldilineaceae bacterium]|nr:response regulator transcription factor [Caldilineaceae bacterium]
AERLGAARLHSELLDLSGAMAAALAALVVPLPPEHTAATQPTQASLPVSQPLVEPLTEREFEVLQLIADGMSNQQIADKLILSVGTVKFYTGQIYGKLGVNSRTQAVAQARALQLLAN